MPALLSEYNFINKNPDILILLRQITGLDLIVSLHHGF